MRQNERKTAKRRKLVLLAIGRGENPYKPLSASNDPCAYGAPHLLSHQQLTSTLGTKRQASFGLSVKYGPALIARLNMLISRNEEV